MDRPHFLRVVQALALVSGFGPVAIVAGATFGACSSSAPQGLFGVACPPDGCAPSAGPYSNDASEVTGILIPPEAGDDGGVVADASTDAAGGDVGTDAAVVNDANADASVDGGPLPPPELPA